MVLNNSIKIISIMIITFITVISIMVTISYSFANHLLKERVENQFLSEVSSRRNAIYLLLNAYLQQINSLNYYLMEDSHIKNIINENSTGKSSTNSSLQIKLNQSSILKQKIERYNILNNLNIDNIEMVNKDGFVLLSTNPTNIGKISSISYYNKNFDKTNTKGNLHTYITNIKSFSPDYTKDQLIKFISYPISNALQNSSTYSLYKD